jgi:copper transport protein
MTVRRAAPLLAALLLAALNAPPAFGHAAFAGSSPAPGERLESSPTRIVMRFTERLNHRLTDATVRAADGHDPVAASLSVMGATITLTPSVPLERGAYTVRWRTTSSDDAHPLEGSFGFGVQVKAAGGAGVTEAGPFARGGWLRAPARMLLYAALLAFAGALFLRALLRKDWPLPRELRSRHNDLAHDEPAIRETERALVVDLGILTVGLGAMSALIEAFTIADELSATAVHDYLLTSLAGGARIAVPVFAALALVLARRSARAAALAIMCALGAVVASGHANSADPRAAGILADWAHLVAAAAWLGGAAVLVLLWWPVARDAGSTGRQAVMRIVLPTFGRVALPAFLLVVVSGSASALIELGHVSALWETAYGVTLTIKIVLVAVIATIAFGHAMRLRPRLLTAEEGGAVEAAERRHWQLLRAEPLLGLGVVAIVGLLVAFPLPPRQRDQINASAKPLALATCDPCPLPAPHDDELAVAGEGGRNVVAAWISRSRAELVATVRLLDEQGDPTRAARAAVVGATSAAPCGTGCIRAHAPPSDMLEVRVTDARGSYLTRLPARWEAESHERAGALLETAQARMRSLRSVLEEERVSSGPGTLALTSYRLRAPDRVALRTDRGVETVIIGRSQWLRTPDLDWSRSPRAGGGSFTTRSWFRWTPYAAHVLVLGHRSVNGRRVTELALADVATPAWIRLRIDDRTRLVLSEDLVAPARFVTHRFHAFGAPLRIAAPRTGNRG